MTLGNKEISQSIIVHVHEASPPSRVEQRNPPDSHRIRDVAESAVAIIAMSDTSRLTAVRNVGMSVFIKSAASTPIPAKVFHFRVATPAGKATSSNVPFRDYDTATAARCRSPPHVGPTVAVEVRERYPRPFPSDRQPASGAYVFKVPSDFW
jgi:hypothetical protein